MNNILEAMKSTVLKAQASMNNQELIAKYTPENHVKGIEGEAHHQVVTAQDMIIQAVLIEELQKIRPDASFIAEEELPDPNLMKNVLNQANFQDAVTQEVFGIDSIDGTAQFNAGKHEWCISLGYSNKLKHEQGVIFAPKLTDGLFYGGREGVFVQDQNGQVQCKQLEPKEKSEYMVEVGQDMALYSEFNKFLNTMANDVRSLTANGSCALGLAYVAAGKSDVFIQPPQRVWDWYAGVALVEGVEGKVQFYKIQEKQVIPVTMQAIEYDPSKKEFGFVAGQPETVDSVFKLLQQTYAA